MNILGLISQLIGIKTLRLTYIYIYIYVCCTIYMLFMLHKFESDSQSLFIKTEVQSLFIFEGHTYIEVIWENFIYYYKSSYNLWLLRSNIFNKGA